VAKFLTCFFTFAIFLLSAESGLAADKPWAIDVVLGKTDAPVTVIEYSSLTCPHCAKFHADTFPDVKKNWIDTGKAKWVIRDFPWDPMAQAGAMIAHCSGDRYFTFIDIFFHSQANWMHAAQPFEALKGIARLGGMTNDQIDKCLQDRKLLGDIEARKDDGQKIFAVDSTPTFIINGKAVSGDKDYDTFAKLLADAKK
jgi:protein-disulfide isomerase